MIPVYSAATNVISLHAPGAKADNKMETYAKQHGNP